MVTRLASATCTERVDGPYATVSIQLIPTLPQDGTYHRYGDIGTSLLVHTDCSEYLQQKFAATWEWP